MPGKRPVLPEAQKPPELKQLTVPVPPSMPDEPETAYRAFNDFCLLGWGRSHPALISHYETLFKETGELIAASVQTIRKWSAQFHWFQRAAEYDSLMTAWRVQDMEDVRRSIIADELEDAAILMGLYRKLVMQWMDNPKSTPAGLIKLTELRENIIKMHRRAAGMPLDINHVVLQGDKNNPIEHRHSGLADDFADLFSRLDDYRKRARETVRGQRVIEGNSNDG